MFREATVDDLTALLDLERAANLAGLGHVFPPERYPFPDDDVLARWALVLDEPGVDVLVRDAQDGGIDLFAAYDDRSLRHLAVHPGQWGSGLATTAIETVPFRAFFIFSTVSRHASSSGARDQMLRSSVSWRSMPSA